jgi:hypothetical protein
MPMMFFYFLKIIFDISTSKRSKRYKPHSILANKKKFQNLIKRSYKRNTKRCRSSWFSPTIRLNPTLAHKTNVQILTTPYEHSTISFYRLAYEKTITSKKTNLTGLINTAILSS